MTVAQVALAWLFSHGITVVTKSESPARLMQNFEAVEMKLEVADRKKADEITHACRLFPDWSLCP